ncbi:MAG: heme exporter protein CcmD [Beijerinckiaceae bacterium]
MGQHAAFILIAYGLTGVAIAGLAGVIIFEYRKLRAALAKFPPREGDARD